MNIPEGFALVPLVPTEQMLVVMHDAVLISVNARNKEANILNDKSWWAKVVAAVPVQPQPATHLTIPGALEWDGDNGTHGADGESGVHGESEVESLKCENETLRMQLVACGVAAMSNTPESAAQQRVKPDSPYFCASVGDVHDAVDREMSLRAQLANTEQSRRSFFDLSQDLEKRLAERDAQIIYMGWHDLGGYVPWVEGGNSLKQQEARRLVGAKSAKQKTCIECDQPYCHGVCVERGDQDYDRDQAAKGGDDE